MKIAVFDFCNTIVNFSTADAFVHFAVDSTADCRIIRRYQSCLWNIGYLSKMENGHGRRFKEAIKNMNLNKRILLWQLRGVEKDAIERYAYQFYIETITPAFHPSILGRIAKYRDCGYTIFVASGGYDVYLQYFAEQFGIDALLCTRLKFCRNKFTGCIEGIDCMGENKVRLLEEYVQGSCGDSLIEDSIAFSDGKSDLPLLKWAKRGVVVSKSRHRTWAKENGLEEIVLTEEIS